MFLELSIPYYFAQDEHIENILRANDAIVDMGYEKRPWEWDNPSALVFIPDTAIRTIQAKEGYIDIELMSGDIIRKVRAGTIDIVWDQDSKIQVKKGTI